MDTLCARAPRGVRFPVRSAGDLGARTEHEVTPSPPSTAAYWPGTCLGSWTGETGFQVGQFPGSHLGRERERTIVLGKASDVATERWDPWGPQQGEPGLGTGKQVQVPSAGRAGGTGYRGAGSKTGRDVPEPQIAPGDGAQERVT